MKHSIYLPDRVERMVRKYLRSRRGASLSSLVQEALEAYVAEPDPSHLLELAGIVEHAEGPPARDRAEDVLPAR
jgi:metal-responsive CopG/Arc/MetJ family transcriptional regulator